MNRNIHNIIILILAFCGISSILLLANFYEVSPIERNVALLMGIGFYGFEINFFWER